MTLRRNQDLTKKNQHIVAKGDKVRWDHQHFVRND